MTETRMYRALMKTIASEKINPDSIKQKIELDPDIVDEVPEADPQFIERAISEHLARYKFQEPLNSRKSIYKVYDTLLERTLALKLERAGNESNIIDEARLIANLNHPNILPIHDYQSAIGGYNYFTMDMVKGDTLLSLINKKSAHIKNLNECISIILQIAYAIAYAHKSNILHNDIKPENIMIGQFGEIRVIDWSNATKIDENSSNLEAGTPLYMSPEQANGQPTTQRSDIYCLGGSLLHLVTMRPPIICIDATIFVELKTKGEYKYITNAERKHIPKPLVTIIEKSLAVEPDARYSSVMEMIEQLENYQKSFTLLGNSRKSWDLLKKYYQTHQKRIISLSLGICLLLFTAWYLEYLKSQSEKHWFLVHSENFDHGDISKPKSKWSGLKLPDYVDSNIIAAPLNSTDLWRIEGGELHIFPGNTGGAYNLCYNEDISGNIRADFEYTPHHNNGNVNCFICGPPRHTAYVFHIGGYGSLNSVRLTKNNITLENKELPFSVEAGTTYQIRMERAENSITLLINNREIVKVTDPDPLIGLSHRRLGIEFQSGHSSVDNISIYNQPTPLKVNPISIAHTYYDNELFDIALAEYQQIAPSIKDETLKALCLYRIGKCNLALGNTDTARENFTNFIYSHSNHYLNEHAIASYIKLIAEQKNWDLCLSEMRKLESKIHNRNIRNTLLSDCARNLLEYAQNLPSKDHPINDGFSGFFAGINPEALRNNIDTASTFMKKFTKILNPSYNIQTSLLHYYLCRTAYDIGYVEFITPYNYSDKTVLYNSFLYKDDLEDNLDIFADDHYILAQHLLNNNNIEGFVVHVKKNIKIFNRQIIPTGKLHMSATLIDYFPNNRGIQLNYHYYNRNYEFIVDNYEDMIDLSDYYLKAYYHLERYDDIIIEVDRSGNNRVAKPSKIKALLKLGKYDEAKECAIEGSKLFAETVMWQTYIDYFKTHDRSVFEELDQNPSYASLNRFEDTYLLRPLIHLDKNQIKMAFKELESIHNNPNNLIPKTHRQALAYITGSIDKHEFLGNQPEEILERVINTDGPYNLYTGIRQELNGKSAQTLKHYKIALEFYKAESPAIEAFIMSRIKYLNR
ncbi:MAG: serine/threonine protein kinase [Planctomycetes bacterium]|nr:serine/threonine protein kinase [Planctomycetota bacterium]